MSDVLLEIYGDVAGVETQATQTNSSMAKDIKFHKETVRTLPEKDPNTKMYTVNQQDDSPVGGKMEKLIVPIELNENLSQNDIPDFNLLSDIDDEEFLRQMRSSVPFKVQLNGNTSTPCLTMERQLDVNIEEFSREKDFSADKDSSGDWDSLLSLEKTIAEEQSSFGVKVNGDLLEWSKGKLPIGQPGQTVEVS